MNFFEANKILDGIKDNLSYNLDTVNKALLLTGDLSESEFERHCGTNGRSSSKDGLAEGLASVCQTAFKRA